MPPMNWLRAVRGLMMRPAAYMPNSRDTRTSPVSASTRTSAKWAPNACLPSFCRSATSSLVS
jgi:hypothetical protein